MAQGAWLLQDRGGDGQPVPPSSSQSPAGEHLFRILHGDYSSARVNPCAPAHSLLKGERGDLGEIGGGGTHGGRGLPAPASFTGVPRPSLLPTFQEQECSPDREVLLSGKGGWELLTASVYPSVRWDRESLAHRLPRSELIETECLARNGKVPARPRPELKGTVGVCARA